MSRFRLALLGGFDLRGESETAVRLPTRKAEALLAYLALAPARWCSRHVLAGLLWGEASERSSGASLRQTLFLIGKTLDRSAIETEGRRVALTRGALETDVAEFEQGAADSDVEVLSRTADLYRGDLLAGLSIDEPSFEEWLVSERERLREHAINLLKRLITIYRDGGNIDRGIQAALRLTVLDPLEESAHRALMLLYASAGRQAAALRQYQVCVSVLQRELGTEPEIGTKELYREILQGQFAPTNIDQSPRLHRSKSIAEHDVSGLPDDIEKALPSNGLIGRDADWLQLREALNTMLGGQGRAVMIVGEAGIGKTTLLSALAVEAGQHGSRVLLGRSYESEQVLPLAPWVDALQSGDALIAQVLEGLAPAWRAELTRIFPEVNAPGLPPPSDDQRRLFQGVSGLIEHLVSVRPLTLLLEDLHWADETSVRLLAFLCRRIRGWPLLVVGTAREEELAEASTLRNALEELRDEHHVNTLKLAPLSVTDSAILVRALTRASSDPVASGRTEEQVWRLSEGNPFVIVETLRALGEGIVSSGSSVSLSIPERLREVISARLDRFSPCARKLATFAAIIGREFNFALLARASGFSEAQAADGVEELVRRRILHGVGERLDFVHDYVRQAAYGRIQPSYRRLLHAQVARALEALYGQDLEPHYALLGLHYEQGAVWDKALAYLKRAGTQAAMRSAYREAAGFFERAIAVLKKLPENCEAPPVQQHLRQAETVDLRLMLRNALLPLGDESRIAKCLHEAEQVAERLGDRRQLARILSYLCRHYWRAGPYSNAVDAGRRALTLAENVGDPEIQVTANLYLGMVHHVLGDFPAGLDHLQRSLVSIDKQRVQKRFGLPYLPAVFAHTWLAWCFADLGDFRKGLIHGHKAIELAESVAQPWDRLVAYRGPGFVHLARGDVSEAMPFLECSVKICESEEFPGMLAIVAGHLGYAHVLSGNLLQGVRLLEEAVQLSNATKSPHESRLQAFLGEALAMAERWEEALPHTRRAVALAGERNERSHQAWALRASAKTAALAHAPEAEARYRETLGLASQLGMRPLVAHCHLDLGEFFHVTKRRQDALRHATAAAKMYRELDMPFWIERAEALMKRNAVKHRTIGSMG